MKISFRLAVNRFDHTWCLIERTKQPSIGSVEDGFYSDASRFDSHNSKSIISAISEIVSEPSVKWLVVSRNPNLIVDEYLLSRIQSSLTRYSKYANQITLISGGGLGINDENLCAFYSSSEPFLKYNADDRPIKDTMLDLYILSADIARDFIDNFGNKIDDAFEISLITYGYNHHNRISIYTPDLSAGVNGHFCNRDLSKLETQINSLGRSLTNDSTLMTMSGPIEIRNSVPIDNLNRPIPTSLRYINKSIKKSLDPFIEKQSVSIVTRTQFSRMHLLRRLLTSICRARVDDLCLQVVLSTDVAFEHANIQLNILRTEFPKIDIVLAVNKRKEHSRVANLLGGVDFATGNYLWFMDDDDYVDLFAFEKIRTSFFLGAQPFILGDSDVQREKWNLKAQSFPVLESSILTHKYPAENWRHMFKGVNQMPICCPLIPRTFFLDRTKQFDFMFDLSEDFTLFLLLLSAPNMPSVYNLRSTIAHISIRDDGENTVTQVDRSGWTRDISNYLHSLLYSKETKNIACWATLTNQQEAHTRFDKENVHLQLKSTIDTKNTQISQLNRTIEHLRDALSNALQK